MLSLEWWVTRPELGANPTYGIGHMRVYHSDLSVAHAPALYYRRGAMVAHPEQASRYRILRDAAAKDGHTLVDAADHGLAALHAVHTADYITFLSTAWARRAEIPGIDHEIGSSHFARPQMARYPSGLLGQIGYHMADTSTPIQAGTWDAIYGSAQAAISAATAVAAGATRSAYALCRPPGHHAYAACAGGFCFLNNTAVAAALLAKKLASRVAILDIDVHHGNGTQGIFYAREDVLTVSIHADPANYFPFYAGYADETGVGHGTGYNINLVLPEGTRDDAWVKTIEAALARIETFSPDALVVALGFDASEHDPIGALKITTSGFARAAALIARTKLPTVLVQEGGYLCDALPMNLTAFLASFENATA
jgi:acetoin utilization deacetylase AcuC-like enzyme